MAERNRVALDRRASVQAAYFKVTPRAQLYCTHMACGASKPHATTQGDATTVHGNTAAGFAAATPQVQQLQARNTAEVVAGNAEQAGAGNPAVLEHNSTTGSVQEWSQRPEDLKRIILGCSPADPRTAQYVSTLGAVVQHSFSLRMFFGDPAILQSLLLALRDGPVPVAKASSHALRLLSFCLSNHTCGSLPSQ